MLIQPVLNSRGSDSDVATAFSHSRIREHHIQLREETAVHRHNRWQQSVLRLEKPMRACQFQLVNGLYASQWFHRIVQRSCHHCHCSSQKQSDLKITLQQSVDGQFDSSYSSPRFRPGRSSSLTPDQLHHVLLRTSSQSTKVLAVTVTTTIIMSSLKHFYAALQAVKILQKV